MSDTTTMKPEARSGTRTGDKPGGAKIEGRQEMPSAEAEAYREYPTSELQARRSPATTGIERPVTPSVPLERAIRPHRQRVLPSLITLVTVVIAIALGWE